MPPRGSQLSGDAVNAPRDHIAWRVQALGVVGATSHARGNKIFLQLPGVTDPQRVIAVLTKTALFEIVDLRGQYLPPGTVVTTTLGGPDTVSAGVSATPPANTPVYTTLISGADLQDAFPTTGQLGESVVGFSVKQDAASKLYAFTRTHIGQPLSIVIDKTVITCPTIHGAIADQGQITGLTVQEVDNLVIELRAGALPVPVRVVQSQTFGAETATAGPAP